MSNAATPQCERPRAVSDVLIHPDWSAPVRVRAVTTTRTLPGQSRTPFDAFNLGAHCGDALPAVASNRAQLSALLDLPAPPCWLRQVHGTSVAVFDAAPAADSAPLEADAAITRTPGVALAVMTADCLPMLICADDGSEVAAIHAGWRGLAGGVIESGIAALRTPRHGLLAWLGPAIGPNSYEVGSEVRETLVVHDAGAAMAFKPTRPGHWYADLYTLARRRLAMLGVTRVFGGGFDTFTDARLYSYRRNHRTGRFASLIWIEP